MIEVYDRKEAEKWFLSHSSGSVMCVDGSRRKECGLFIDAEEFFMGEFIMTVEVAERMKQYGGSFVQALADAWYKADHVNKKKLEDTFEYFRDYERQLARVKDREEEENESAS